jgi:Tol biopolymer transport system component
MPPKGTVQRRLTFTANTPYPGCGGVVRSSPDGTRIACLAKDNNGIQQIFLLSPLGGTPYQVTEHKSDVQSAPRWCHDNNSIAYIWDNSIVLCEISDRPFAQRCKRLTLRSDDPPSNLVWSFDGKTIAFNRLIPAEGKTEKVKQIFVVKLNSKN